MKIRTARRGRYRARPNPLVTATASMAVTVAAAGLLWQLSWWAPPVALGVLLAATFVLAGRWSE